MEFTKLRQAILHPQPHLLARSLWVFIVIFLAAQLGQYLYFEWSTSPAILWPPTGIGVAIMWLYGYRYAVPIFLALLLTSLTGPTAYFFPGVVTTPISQILGQILGVYLLHRLNFAGKFTSVRTVMVFFIAIIVSTSFSSGLSSFISYVVVGGNGGESLRAFSRLWAGYAFSCLIMTPFVIAWILPDTYKYKNSLLETILAGSFLSIATYLLFWTRLASQYGFIMFAIFLAAVIWPCLRFSPRVVTLSVVFVTVFGILGLFASPSPGQTLSSQIFASELFLFLVVPIMYAYSALVIERQKNLEDLKQALTRIEMENANKTNFISVLAHELRNPLAPIKTTLEIIRLQKFEPEIEQLITTAHNQVHVMRRLLDDLLDMTRVTQGKFSLTTETVQLLPLIHNVIEATKIFVQERGHALVLQNTSPGTVMVKVDPIRFEQVLVNVINNAAKYTSEGGKITVSYAVVGANVELRIEDNGKGIEAENLEQIFNSFWQIKNSSRHSASGIGVGLALARQIVELHGGTIRAESQGLGRGSTFVISIPGTVAHVVEAGTKKDETPTIQKYEILVVDDNKPAADALAKLLTLKGHVTHTCYSGSEALQAVAGNGPEIVLLDIGLLDMSGYEVARGLRKRGFKGALIAVSGYGQLDDKKNALDAGFDTHFTKPMSISTLEAYLKSWKKE